MTEAARAKAKPEALEALETWKARHPLVARQLEPADVLVDGMRGRSSLWYRIRINRQHGADASARRRSPRGRLRPWASERAGRTDR